MTIHSLCLQMGLASTGTWYKVRGKEERADWVFFPPGFLTVTLTQSLSTEVSGPLKGLFST